MLTVSSLSVSNGVRLSLIKSTCICPACPSQLTARRETQQPTYVPKPLELSEYKTRKLYIDSMLTDAGWVEGKNWVNEVPLPGMPNKSGIGYAD